MLAFQLLARLFGFLLQLFLKLALLLLESFWIGGRPVIGLREIGGMRLSKSAALNVNFSPLGLAFAFL